MCPVGRQKVPRSKSPVVGCQYLARWPGVCSLSRRVSVMYDVKSSSGVVNVAHGVRRGMGFVPFPLCTNGFVQ